MDVRLRRHFEDFQPVFEMIRAGHFAVIFDGSLRIMRSYVTFGCGKNSAGSCLLLSKVRFRQPSSNQVAPNLVVA